jgi:hypothetical protein
MRVKTETPRRLDFELVRPNPGWQSNISIGSILVTIDLPAFLRCSSVDPEGVLPEGRTNEKEVAIQLAVYRPTFPSDPVTTFSGLAISALLSQRDLIAKCPNSSAGFWRL